MLYICYEKNIGQLEIIKNMLQEINLYQTISLGEDVVYEFIGVVFTENSSLSNLPIYYMCFSGPIFIPQHFVYDPIFETENNEQKWFFFHPKQNAGNIKEIQKPLNIIENSEIANKPILALPVYSRKNIQNSFSIKNYQDFYNNVYNYPGLPNKRETCFINCILQLLAHNEFLFIDKVAENNNKISGDIICEKPVLNNAKFLLELLEKAIITEFYENELKEGNEWLIYRGKYSIKH